MDYYLKFNSEDAAKAVLFDGEAQKYRNIDTVGVIYKNTGTEEEPVMTALPGWHVNVRLVDEEDGTVLEPYAVEVATPMRVWA